MDGGNKLTGGAQSYNQETGDALTVQRGATGGANTVVAGLNSTTFMWGGAANVDSIVVIKGDDFVFAPGDALGYVMNFRHGPDVIDLTGYAQLNITTGNGASTIHLGADTLVVENDVKLVASDFRLA